MNFPWFTGWRKNSQYSELASCHLFHFRFLLKLGLIWRKNGPKHWYFELFFKLRRKGTAGTCNKGNKAMRNRFGVLPKNCWGASVPLGEFKVWRTQNKICLGGILDLEQSLCPGACWAVVMAWRMGRRNEEFGNCFFLWDRGWEWSKWAWMQDGKNNLMVFSAFSLCPLHQDIKPQKPWL